VTRRIVLAALTLSLVGMVPCLALFFRGTPALCFLHGFEERVKAKVRVEDLEKWALELKKLNGGGEASRGLKRSEELEQLRDEDPHPYWWVYFASNRLPAYAIIAWGGGFGRWGLYISLDGRDPRTDPQFEFVRWSGNVYFFIQ